MDLMKKPSIACFFFFQAEDGIRDLYVTGVQTCALPIYGDARQAAPSHHRERRLIPDGHVAAADVERLLTKLPSDEVDRSLPDECLGRPRSRSEERRVGKECTPRWRRADEEERKEDSHGD